MRIRNQGKFVGQFKRAKRRKIGKRQMKMMQGFKTRIERGGTYEDGQALYVGATTHPVNTFMLATAACILKELLRQAGSGIQDWTQPCWKDAGLEKTYRIQYQLYTNATTAVLTDGTFIDFTSLSTALDVAQQIATAFQTTFGSNKEYYLDNVLLRQRGSAGSATSFPEIIGTINANQFFVKLDGDVNMCIQNNTLAASGEDDDNRNNVTNNPIYGKVYEVPATGFMRRVRVANPLTNTGNLLSDPTTGHIEARSSNMDRSNFVKPPPHWFFTGCKKSARIDLQPGQIKRYKFSAGKSYNLQKMLHKLHDEIDDERQLNWFGKSVLLGLEKLVDNRTEINPVSISWETNLVFTSSYKYFKKNITVPYNNVT
jgi:hypothetical protein